MEDASRSHNEADYIVRGSVHPVDSDESRRYKRLRGEREQPSFSQRPKISGLDQAVYLEEGPWPWDMACMI